MDRIFWFMHSHQLIISICAGLELLKMTYVILSSCFAYTRKPKIFLVGILDLIFGVPGLTVIVIPIVFASSTRTFIKHGENSESALLEEIATPLLVLCGFPTLTGILTVVASIFQSYNCAKVTILVRSLIILMWAVVISVLSLFYINYYGYTDYSKSELYVYFFRHIQFFFGAPASAVLAQLYFIRVLVKYCRSDEVKGGGGMMGMMGGGGGGGRMGSSVGENSPNNDGRSEEQRPLTETTGIFECQRQQQRETWVGGGRGVVGGVCV